MLLLLFTTALAAPLALDPAFIQQHNAAGGASWTAGVNERFAGLTVDEASALIGQVKTLTDPAEVEDARRGFDVIRGNSQANRDAADAVAVGRVPENFDARTQWPGCVHGVRNQGNCGGCWAYGGRSYVPARAHVPRFIWTPPPPSATHDALFRTARWDESVARGT